MQELELIYDWNTRTPGFSWETCRVELNDETLRDGLQSPSVTDPSIEDKKALLHLMAELGIAAANIGLPGAGPRARYGAAIACGARRVCLADTGGHATPDGVRALVRFVREEIIAPTKLDVRIDWHGHRDRGHGLANCMAAIEAGVDRVHGTALGIGERVGNAEMDLLLINLRLLGVHKHDLRKLPEYTALVSRALGVAIPASYPVFGEDAFRTATGVHAAAIASHAS